MKKLNLILIIALFFSSALSAQINISGQSNTIAANFTRIDAMSINPGSINQGHAANTLVGTLSDNDPNSSHNNSYSLPAGQADNDKFTLEGNTLKLGSQSIEELTTLQVRVLVSDGAYSKKFPINISVNQVWFPPTAINLSKYVVAENQDARTIVGTLSAEDENLPNDSHTFAFTNIDGHEFNNSSFILSGNVLKTDEKLTLGTYKIILLTTDSQGYPHRERLNITVVGENTATITGVVSFEGIPLEAGDAKVFLYAHTDEDDKLSAVHVEEGGKYTFAGIDVGKYFIKAKVKGNNDNGRHMAPTYHLNGTSWDNPIESDRAKKIEVGANEVATANIEMLSYESHAPGDAVLSGTVGYDTGESGAKSQRGIYLDSNAETIEPDMGVQIFLQRTSDNGIVAGATTDNEGKYYFDNIPVGEFNILVEMTNITQMEGHTITVTEEETFFPELNYKFREPIVIPPARPEGTELIVYPNPSEGVFYVVTPIDPVSASLSDLSGKIIRSYEAADIQELMTIDLSDFNKGVYILKVNTTDESYLSKLIKE